MAYEVGSDRVPFFKQYVSVVILFANIIFFVIQYADPTGNMYIYDYALIPSEFLAGQKSWTIFTSMFMHVDIWHIVGNMMFFIVIADNCEKVMGHILFLITYILSGLCAAFLHIYLTNILFPDQMGIPTLGASGAIFGIIAVYGILFPKNKLAIFMIPIAIPAFLFVFIYFGLQIFYAWYYFGGSSTAYFAHIGGFIVGAIIAVFFRLFKKDYKDRLYS